MKIQEDICITLIRIRNILMKIGNPETIKRKIVRLDCIKMLKPIQSVLGYKLLE